MPPPQHAVRTGLLLLASLLVTTATIAALLSSPGRDATGMQLLVSPHPDDELLVWAAIEDDPSTYTVVLTLTRGEATTRCPKAEESTQQQAGEVLPEMVPAAKGSTECGQARITAWRSFLSGASEQTSEVALGRSEHVRLSVEDLGGEADVWMGEDAAYLALSLPDGALDADGVAAAIRAVLDLRGTALPDVPLRRVLAASYWNDSGEHGERTASSGDCQDRDGCRGVATAFEYENLDHRAVSRAMGRVAEQTEVGAWVSVPPGDGAGLRALLGNPEAEVRTQTLPLADYEMLMGLGPVGDEGPEREGLAQRFYGWLTFPRPWWSVGEVSDPDVLYPRQQSYLVLPGGES